MKSRLLRGAALACTAALLFTSCQKDDLLKDSQQEDAALLKAQVGKNLAVMPELSKLAKKSSVKLQLQNKSFTKTDQITSYLLQKINKAKTQKAVAPSDCSPTPFDAQIDKYIGQFGDLEFDLYSTYSAISQLYSIIDDSKQYFGAKGQYTSTVTKHQKRLEAFWKMPDEIQINGQHNSTLDNRDRVAQVYILFAGLSEEDAYAVADEIIAINKFSPVFIETPLLSFDGFSTTAELIVVGDGLVQVLSEAGTAPDITFAGIVAHEWGHQVQSNNSLKWYGLPAYLWPATPEFTRFIELEADFFAAYYMSARGGSNYSWKKVSQFLNIFYNIGDCSFASANHHGTPKQRLATARLAYLIAQAIKYTGIKLNATQIHNLYVAVISYVINDAVNAQAAMAVLTDPQLRPVFRSVLLHKAEVRQILDGKLSKAAIDNL